MVAMCQERGIKLAVFYQLRFCNEFARLKRAIAGGEIGDLQRLDAYCYGNLFDQGSHMVDMLRWLLPERAPAWVAAQGWTDLPEIARFAELPPTFGEPSILQSVARWKDAQRGNPSQFELILVTDDRSRCQLTLPVPAAALDTRAVHWLIVHADPWRPPDLAPTEVRRLGLPIDSVSFRPSADEHTEPMA
jgi:predicted dehydrogenase